MNVKTKVFRIPQRGKYEDKLNDFLKKVDYIDMKVVPQSADFAFDIIVIYKDKLDWTEETENVS